MHWGKGRLALPLNVKNSLPLPAMFAIFAMFAKFATFAKFANATFADVTFAPRTASRRLIRTANTACSNHQSPSACAQGRVPSRWRWGEAVQRSLGVMVLGEGLGYQQWV